MNPIENVPVAPGTLASLVAVLIGAVALWIDHRALTLLAIVTCVVGIWAVSESNAEGDPGWIVIDEIAGQMIALLALPHVSLAGLVLAFIAFRFFDITKLGPIGWVDGRHDAWGIMGDDWLAGIAAAIVLLLVRLVWPL